jgi:Tol biopolymer transport system component
VQYLDRPSPEQPAGIYAVGLEGGDAQLVTDKLGIYSPDQQYRAFPEGELVVIERLSDGQRWHIANGGRAVSFSPDSTQLAWTAGQSGPPFDTAQRQVWVSQVDGSQARLVVGVIGGGFSGWFPDGRMLVSGKHDPQEQEPALWVVDPQEGSASELVRGERLRGGLISPGGSWLVYQVTFAADPAEDGIWLVAIASGERYRLDLFGAYRWRDDNRLLIIPMQAESGSNRLWQASLQAGEPPLLDPLTDPAVTPFKVASGDWTVAPDGSAIAFVSAADHNIYLLPLP